MKKFIYPIAMALLAMAAASCDNNEEPAPWQPAEPSDAPGIFFTNVDNILTVTVGESTEVAIPVRRLDTSTALTVPLVVKAGHDALIVPKEVTFEQGQQDAQIIVDLANIPTKQLIDLNITFPDDYVNPYVAGSTIFDGQVIVSDWEAVSDEPVEIQWLDWSYNPSTLFDPMPHVVMSLPGTTRYRICNFFGTEYDLTFDLQPSTYTNWDGYDRIVPLGNQVLYSEYAYTGNYNPWWFVSDDLQEWPEVEVYSNDDPITLYGLSFMWYDDEYGNEYCYMRRAGSVDVNGNVSETNKVYMATYGFYDESWDWANFTGYMFIYFEFPEK